MRKPVRLTPESFLKLVPVSSLDERGLDLYSELRIRTHGARGEWTPPTTRVAARLLDHLCELGLFARKGEGPPGEMWATYQDRRGGDAGDTIRLRVPEEPLEHEPGAAPATPATAPGYALGDDAIDRLVKLIAASRLSDVTELTDTVLRFRRLLRCWLRCDSVVVCLTGRVSDSDVGKHLEDEGACTSTNGEAAPPAAARECAEATGESVRVSLNGPGRAGSATDGPDELLVVPLMGEAETLGTLSLRWNAPHEPDSRTRRFAELAAGLMGKVIRLYREVSPRIYRDKLTDLYNFAYFEEQMPREIDRSKRSGRPMGFLIADVDGFKQVNDELGHDAGNDALKHVADVISGSVRPTDIVTRFGGEEFAVILPGADADAARTVAERVREHVEESELSTGVPGQPTRKITISVGGALYPADTEDRAELVELADDALMARAKKCPGKNTVVMHGDPVTAISSPRRLCDATGISAGDLAAFVGAGGKTGSILALADELTRAGLTVLASTTTRVGGRFGDQMPVILAGEAGASLERVRRSVAETIDRNRAAFLARSGTEDGKLEGVPPEWLTELGALDVADVVLVECDGARQKSLKFPDDHEPVIPSGANLVVTLAGLDVLGQQIDEQTTHRHELLLEYAGSDTITRDLVARMLTDVRVGLKGIPDGAACVPMLSHVEPSLARAARDVAARIFYRRRDRIRRVVLADLRQSSYTLIEATGS
jgi:probable selenium-dependent hydroxylase accessory protein YqeC